MYWLGDNVLIFDEFVLYPGKCIKRRKTTDGISEYLIHFNNMYNWVYDPKLLEVNEKNLEKMAFNQRI